MLLTDIKTEARALRAYEQDGADPEPVAALWFEATLVEFAAVVRQARIFGLPTGEWLEDVIFAHKWNRRNPTHPDAPKGYVWSAA